MLLRFIAVAAIFLGVHPAFAEEKEEREGGIVGTGIVGEITELGSILVNGQKIEIISDLPVVGSVPDITAGALKPGQTVAVVATLEGETWKALGIRQVLPLVGPVEAVGDGSLSVLGTTIDLGALAIAVNEGDWVAVSGFWRSERILATAIEHLPDWQGPAQVSGTFFETDGVLPARIGASEIAGIDPQHISSGAFAHVTGAPIPGGIDASRLETTLFDAPVGIIQAEGFFSDPEPDGLYTVLGSGLISYTDRPEMVQSGTRTIQCGANGRLGVFAVNDLSPEEIETIRRKLDCL